MTNNQNSRKASVDIYRGFVMLLMMAEVMEFYTVAQSVPESSFWSFLGYHQSHVAWVGCSLHDMIQPSFTFLVGVVIPFSLSTRKQKDNRFWILFRHVIVRSLILIGLGIFLRSQYSHQTNFTFEDTLTQIGLGYTFLFFISYLTTRYQIISLVTILIGYWFFFVLHPLPSPEFVKYGLEGFSQHWNFNTNAADAFDRYFLNLFPRESTFTGNEGGYVTLSFIPTLGTMVLGLLAGNILHNKSVQINKVKQFLIIGASLIVVSLVMHWLDICPIVKRIWTPSWVLFSGGICFLMLTFFYVVIDVKDRLHGLHWLKIIGMNSIAAYVIADGLRVYTKKSVSIHLGDHFANVFGVEYKTLILGLVVLGIELLLLRWMYKQKIFIKI